MAPTPERTEEADDLGCARPREVFSRVATRLRAASSTAVPVTGRGIGCRHPL